MIYYRSSQVKATLDSIISLNLTSRIENFRSRIEDVVRDYINKEEERKKLTENKEEINATKSSTEKLSGESTSQNQTQENSTRLESIANTLIDNDNATIKVIPTSDRNSTTVTMRGFKGNDKNNNTKSYMDVNKNFSESAIELSKTASTRNTVQSSKNELKSSLENVTNPARILYENIKDTSAEDCKSDVKPLSNCNTLVARSSTEKH